MLLLRCFEALCAVAGITVLMGVLHFLLLNVPWLIYGSFWTVVAAFVAVGIADKRRESRGR